MSLFGLMWKWQFLQVVGFNASYAILAQLQLRINREIMVCRFDQHRIEVTVGVIVALQGLHGHFWALPAVRSEE